MKRNLSNKPITPLHNDPGNSHHSKASCNDHKIVKEQMRDVSELMNTVNNNIGESTDMEDILTGLSLSVYGKEMFPTLNKSIEDNRKLVVGEGGKFIRQFLYLTALNEDLLELANKLYSHASSSYLKYKQIVLKTQSMSRPSGYHHSNGYFESTGGYTVDDDKYPTYSEFIEMMKEDVTSHNVPGGLAHLEHVILLHKLIAVKLSQSSKFISEEFLNTLAKLRDFQDDDSEIGLAVKDQMVKQLTLMNDDIDEIAKEIIIIRPEDYKEFKYISTELDDVMINYNNKLKRAQREFDSKLERSRVELDNLQDSHFDKMQDKNREIEFKEVQHKEQLEQMELKVLEANRTSADITDRLGALTEVHRTLVKESSKEIELLKEEVERSNKSKQEYLDNVKAKVKEVLRGYVKKSTHTKEVERLENIIQQLQDEVEKARVPPKESFNANTTFNTPSGRKSGEIAGKVVGTVVGSMFEVGSMIVSGIQNRRRR